MSLQLSREECIGVDQTKRMGRWQVLRLSDLSQGYTQGGLGDEGGKETSVQSQRS